MKPWIAAAYIACAATLSAATPFSIEQVLSAPFPTELVASPAGNRVAWIFDAQGVRNVWIAEGPDFKARAITSYNSDDGQEISDLAWAGDGSAVVYVRGGTANPTSNPAGVTQDVCVAPISGNVPKVVGNGGGPAISPDGKTVAFLRGGQIWSAPADGSKPAQQMIHTRGAAGELRWSPNGAAIAFSSGRSDHGFIGVYTFATKELRYLEPSVDRDNYFTWSPDSTRIAFCRIPAEPNFYSHPPRASAIDPWSIRVADVKTGASREIFKADPGAGSAIRLLAGSNQLLWGADDRIVFPWERDGWLHLYSVQTAGGTPLLLTPGDFEVERGALTPDRSSVVYASNQGDIDRRHIWRVPVGEAKPVSLTRGEGIEYQPVVTSDGTVATLRSDAKIPARPAVAGEQGALRDIASETMPGDFPAASMVTPQAVMISAADGMQIHGQLLLPPGYDRAKKYPAIIFFHGGSRRQMLLGWHSMTYYHQAYAFNQYLASKGYIVLSVNYRGGIGYGLDFREVKDFGPNGGSEYNDVIGSGLYLRSREDVDPSRIGVWGGSYGGYLTALALARASDMFAVGVDLHGVHDWNLEIRNQWPAYQPEKQPEIARKALLSSPMAYIDGWRSPVLLIQGDDDRNVVFSQTVILAEALRKQKVHFEQLIFPDEVHDFLVHAHWIQAYRASEAFLGKYLLRAR